MVCPTCIILAPMILLANYLGIPVEFITTAVGALTFSIAYWFNSYLVNKKIIDFMNNRNKQLREENITTNYISQDINYEQARKILRNTKHLLYIPLQLPVICIIFLVLTMLTYGWLL